MLICIGVTAFTLSQFAKLIQHLLTLKYDWKFELFMVVGQLIFQLPFIYKKSFALKTDYYLNMLLVSLMGSLLLLPLLVLNHFYNISSMVNISYFFGAVVFMFFEHKRRVIKLLLPKFISYTWVLYRLIILIFIIWHWVKKLL